MEICLELEPLMRQNSHGWETVDSHLDGRRLNIKGKKRLFRGSIYCGRMPFVDVLSHSLWLIEYLKPLEKEIVVKWTFGPLSKMISPLYLCFRASVVGLLILSWKKNASFFFLLLFWGKGYAL